MSTAPVQQPMRSQRTHQGCEDKLFAEARAREKTASACDQLTAFRRSQVLCKACSAELIVAGGTGRVSLTRGVARKMRIRIVQACCLFGALL